MTDIIEQANQLLNEASQMKTRQIKKIVKIARYNFRWKRSAIFEFIVKTFPELIGQVPIDFQNTYNTSALYAAMSKEQLRTIIQRLEAIERRNKGK